MSETSEPPQIGKADAHDRADRNCQIILREVGFKEGSPYATVDGWIVWEGRIDVASAALADANVKLLYRRVGRDWHEVTATQAGSLANNMEKFTFEMYEGISTGNEGGLNWQQMKIELVPFLELDDGSRVFDHNVNADDFTNYTLDYSWGTGRRPFVLRTDPTKC